ncbi:MAG: YbaK/EbsC family protein [Planctomycetota bacterium]
MAVEKKIIDYLKHARVPYKVLSHELAYTAQEVAAKSHISGREIAKVVILKVDGELVMAVVPAPRHVDLDKFSEATRGRSVALAHEDEFVSLFPDVDRGAEPPFGKLYGLDLYVDKRLAEDEEIVFNAGTHTDVIRMKYADFVKLADPWVADIAAGV